MGQIFLKDKDGLTQGFTIKGDQPTPTEQARIQAKLSGTPLPEAPTAPVDNTGIMSAFAQGIGSGWNQTQAGMSGLAALAARKVSGDGTFAGYTPEEWEASRKEQQAESEQYYRPEGTLGEQEGLYGKTRYLSYQLGQSAPATVGGIIGAAVGSALGPAGTVGGFVAGAGGAGLASVPQNYQQNLEEQENTYGKVNNPEKAFIGAIGQSALEGVADRATLGVAGIVGKGVPDIAKSLIRDATKGAFAKAAKRVGGTTLTGMTAEAATEAVQQGIQRWQADKPLGGPEAQREYLENAIVGGLLGGVTGGAFGTVGAALEYREKAKADQIQKDLDEIDTVGDYREANKAARLSQAGAEIAAEDKVSHPLLEDLRIGQDLISGPRTVTRPTTGRVASETGSEVATGPVPGKITPTQAPSFSTQEYSDAVAKMTGEKLVSSDKIKNTLKVGRNKADAIFNEMMKRGDGVAAGSKGQYLTVVTGATSGDVETKADGKIKRLYEVRPVAKEDVAPYNVRRAADTKNVGPSFKTAEEAFAFAEQHPNLGDFSVVQNEMPNRYGVYEVTSGVEGQKPVSRFVRSYPDSAAARQYANGLNPQLSPDTNEELANNTTQARVAARAKEMMGQYQANAQAIADKLLGPGRSFVEVSDFINAPDGHPDTIIEGVTDPDMVNGMRRIRLAADIFDPSQTPSQRQAAINSVAHHELIHAMKGAGLFTPGQWASLGKRANQRIGGKNYTYLERAQVRNKGAPVSPNMTEAEKANLMNEEAIAEMFRDYMRDPTAFQGDTRSLLRKLADFIRTLGQYTRVMAEGNEVLRDIESGKVGEQDANPSRASLYGPYYSSVRIPGFYLKSAKYFEDIATANPNLAYPGQQWLGMLNPSKTGIKDEELVWLGLKDWLKDQKKVPVKDILQYIGANSIDIHQKTNDTPFNKSQMMAFRERLIELETAREKATTRAERDDINFDIDELKAERDNIKNRLTAHEETTQEGGTDYTEFVFHMPHLEPQFSVSTHYDGFPNIIATGRFKTRHIDGKKTLFIEEMQSDLHQQGKKKGYTSASDIQKLENLRDEYERLYQERAKFDEDHLVGSSWNDLTREQQRRFVEIGKDMNLIQDDINALEKIMEIPDAPFKTSWSDLVIKRLVRHAAENGFEAITWNAEPEGVALTENYNRSGGVYPQKLEEVTEEDGTRYKVTVRDAYDNVPIESQDVTGIVNFYTKRLANDIKKLFKDPKFGSPVPQIIPRVEASGADLNLEELFPTLQDFQMVMQELATNNPDLAADPEWTKRYKKASQIAMQQRTFDPMAAMEKAGLGTRWQDDFNEAFPEYAIENTTATLDKAGNPNVARWKLDITPELKATALDEGFPLFSSVNKRKAPDTNEFRKWFGGSKVVGDDGEPITVYHGTFKDFDRFEKGIGRGYYGAGFYFSNNSDDASSYTREDNGDFMEKAYEEYDRRFADRETRKKYEGKESQLVREIMDGMQDHKGAVIPAYLAIKKPIYFGGKNETQFDGEMRSKFLSALNEVKEKYLNVDVNKLAGDFKRNYEDDEVLSADDFRRAVLHSGGLMDAIDPFTGMDAAPEVMRETFQAMGFDGIVDDQVSSRFRGQGLNDDTIHFVAFNPEQVKSVNNNGEFSEVDPRFMYSAVTPRYSAAAPMGQRTPSAVPLDRVADFEAKITYNNIAPALEKLLRPFGKGPISQERARKIAEGTVFNLQDIMQPLGKLIDRVKENGGSISNETDAYLRQQLMTGQIEDQLNKSKKDIIDPLVKAVQNLHVTKADVDELLARHPSNVVTVNGVPYEKAAVRNIIQNYADPKMALAEVYLYAQHAKERNVEMRRRNMALAGVRPEQFDSGSGMSDVEANDVLMWFGSKPFASEFADLSNANSIRSLYRKLISRTNDVRVEGGLNPDFRTMRDQNGDPVDKYQDYAPLRGYTDNNPDQIDDLTQAFIRAGKRLNISGKEDRSAVGRASEASNLIAHAILQHDEAIVRAQKNKVGQTFLNMLRNNMGIRLSNGPNAMPNEMADFAEVVPLEITKPMYDRTSGVVRMTTSSRRMDKDIMIVKEGGKETGIQIKDPRLRQALLGNTMLGDTGTNALINGLLKVNRVLAAVRTSYNPEFFVTNFFRDFGAAQLNLSELQVKGLRTDVLKSVLPAIGGVYNSLADKRAGSQWRAVFEDFSAHGGKTAYMGTRDLETTINRTLDELSTDPAGNYQQIKNKITAVGRLVEHSNDAVENGIRVATYKHLTDRLLAMSNNPTNPQEIERIKNRAAYHAKNLTVNFNMGGAQKPMLNAFYLFFNASIQGSAALVNPLIRSKTVRRIWLSAIAAGALQDIVMSTISAVSPDGEKEYDKIPEYILENNIILINPFSESGYMKIPMPYLFNAAFNSGRAAMRGTRGGYTPGEAINSIMGTAVSTLNPWGSGGSFLNFVAPTLADPLVDLAVNTNFMGTPIAPEKEPYSSVDLPAQRYWNNTSGFYTTVADVLDKSTGGDGVFKGGVSFSPNQYEYAFEFLGGGAWSTMVRAWGLVSPNGPTAKALQGEEMSANDVPFIRRFAGNLTSREDMNLYVKNRDRVMSVLDAMKDARKTGDSERYLEIIQKYPEEYKVASRISAIDTKRRKIGSQIKKIRASKLSDEEKKKLVKPLEDQQKDLVNQANLFMSQ